MNFTRYLWVFFVSMLPIVELRGAIPIGVGMGLPFIPVYLIAAFGNILPVPVILFLVKPVLQFMAKFKIFTKLVNFVLEKGHAAGAKFGDAKYWALFTFVAIPLPGTGAWTGSLAAALLDLDKGKSFIAVMGGVLAAGIIMGIASYGLLGAIGLVF
ncbi:MAG: small multi-drug export protein [Oscillospiraceae bacterium]|nr:small multi-drug export protein [Oscillospiraceae bacterium]